MKKAKKETNSFVKKQKRVNYKNVPLGYRNYMLLKIIMNNGKHTYLFEIDRKIGENCFPGMMFSFGYEIYNEMLVELLYGVMEQKGVVKKVKLPRTKNITFGHKVNKEKNLNGNIQSALKKTIKNDLFRKKMLFLGIIRYNSSNVLFLCKS